MGERKYKTHNEVGTQFNGTSLRGYIETDFRTLIELFGQPEPMPLENKIDWMFVVYLVDSKKLHKKLEAGEVQCYDRHFMRKKQEGHCIVIPPQQVITIYNWKNGPGYGIPLDPYDLKEWHVGGNYSNSVEIAQALIDAKGDQ